MKKKEGPLAGALSRQRSGIRPIVSPTSRHPAYRPPACTGAAAILAACEPKAMRYRFLHIAAQSWSDPAENLLQDNDVLTLYDVPTDPGSHP